tara:strand:- start:1164 stop:1436 length:273 start_codon:yes stop_codon:yes gene_type:complete
MFETTKFENRSSYRPRTPETKENAMTLDQSGPKRLTIYLNEEVWGKLQRLNNYLGMQSSSVVQALVHREFTNKRRYIEVVEKYAPEEGEE